MVFGSGAGALGTEEIRVMGVREDLITAKALIDTPEKWGKYWSVDGPMCIVRALQEKAGLYTPAQDIPAYLVLCSVLPDDHKKDFGAKFAGSFNDAPTTTHSDIMALFDRAIAAAEVAS